MDHLYTAEEKKLVFELSEQGIIYLYAFCENYIAGGVRRSFSRDGQVMAIRAGGVNYLPRDFFCEALGAELCGAGEGASLKRGGAEFSLYKNKEGILPIERGGAVLVPGVQCARALGLTVRLYCNEKLIAIGDGRLLDKLDENERLPEAASFLVFGEYPTSFTKEEFRFARERWRMRTLGNAEINDKSNPYIAKKIKQIEDRCDYQLSRMNLQPDATVLFGEMRIPVESDELSHHYVPLWDMAKAYGTYGSRFYKSKELCEKIRYGLQWGYEHLYGEAERRNEGWRDIKACNWWHWMVGAPDPMTDILITMEDEFSFEEKERYLSLFIWFLTWRCNTDDSAMTRVVVCTKAALILEKPEMLLREYVDYNLTIRVGMGTSVRIDYTDWSHAMPYNVGYGQLKLDRSLYVAANLAGTAMQFRSPRTYNIFEMLRFTFGPAIYRCQGFVMLHGRNNHIAESSCGSKICVDTINMIGLFGEEEDEYIKAFIRRNAATDQLADMMLARCGIFGCAKLGEILKLPMPAPTEFAYAWFTGDRVTQHRNGYAVGFSMNSSRSKSYESILEMNKMGWYTTDGATYYYTPYDYGQYDGKNFMFNPSVAQRIPGTTEDVREREPRSIHDNPWYSETPYAGGITVSDQFALAAMEYVSEHFEGPEHGNISGYGGTRAIFDNDLFANKAWFSFDKDILCLGSKIRSTMNSDIVTTIEHRRILLDEERDICVSVRGERRVLPKEDFLIIEQGVDYIYMEGHGGFVTDPDATVYIHRYRSPECEDQPFIEFGYSHGKNPNNEKYAYNVILSQSEDFVRESARNPRVRILQRDESVLAAACPDIGVCGYAFYAPAECGDIKTDSRLVCITRECGGICELRISDVTQLLTSATVNVRCEGAEVLDHSDAITPTLVNDGLCLHIDLTESYGRPYFVKFKKA